VHFGQNVARCDRIAALLEAADADGVVDGVVLRLASRAQASSK